MFRGNERHTGVYDAVGVPQFHGVKWAFATKGQLIASPAVVGKTVYVGSTGGVFYAVDRETGKERWNVDLKSRTASSPAVANGRVYFGAMDGNFYALDAATGHTAWKFKTGGERRFSARPLWHSEPTGEMQADPWDSYLSSPVVWNGTVYFGSGDGNIYALDAASGALRWKFTTGNVVHASPAIADGMLFIGSWDENLYALDATSGKEKWRFKTGDDPDYFNQMGIQSSPAVVDGTVYFGCRDSNLWAIDEQTGAKKWNFSTKGSWVNNSPAVSGGRVFFENSDGGQLFALNTKDGSVSFVVSMSGWPAFSSPAIAGHMLYVGTTAGKLLGVDIDAGKIAWTFTTEAAKRNGPAFTKPDGTSNYFAAFTTNFYDDMVATYNNLLVVGPILSSPVVVGNNIYVGGVDGNLYALE